MIPDRIESHAAEAVALLTDKWKGRPVVEGLLSALVKPNDDMEAAVFAALEGRCLGNARGFWLNALGSLVGEPRDGRGDTVYESVIRVRIRVNRSQGRTFDVIEVALLLDAAATYLDYYPLAWEVEIYDTAYGGEFSRLLAQTKAASSYGVLLTSNWPVEDVSQFTDAEGPTLDDEVFESAI